MASKSNTTVLVVAGVVAGAVALYFLTKKKCPPGFIMGANNQCIPFTPPVGGVCPPGTAWNDAWGVCAPV